MVNFKPTKIKIISALILGFLIIAINLLSAGIASLDSNLKIAPFYWFLYFIIIYLVFSLFQTGASVVETFKSVLERGKRHKLSYLGLILSIISMVYFTLVVTNIVLIRFNVPLRFDLFFSDLGVIFGGVLLVLCPLSSIILSIMGVIINRKDITKIKWITIWNIIISLIILLVYLVALVYTFSNPPQIPIW